MDNLHSDYLVQYRTVQEMNNAIFTTIGNSRYDYHLCNNIVVFTVWRLAPHQFALIQMVVICTITVRD